MEKVIKNFVYLYICITTKTLQTMANIQHTLLTISFQLFYNISVSTWLSLTKPSMALWSQQSFPCKRVINLNCLTNEQETKSKHKKHDITHAPARKQISAKFAFHSGFKRMMTSSNGNIFRVTGHLCGEFTGYRWVPLTKVSDAEIWCFLWSAPEQTVE